MSVRSTDALKIIDRLLGRGRGPHHLMAEETISLRLAQLMYDARTNAALSQIELAKLVGTTQSVITRLEDADYDGNSFKILIRIAATWDKHFDIRFLTVPADRQQC